MGEKLLQYHQTPCPGPTVPIWRCICTVGTWRVYSFSSFIPFFLLNAMGDIMLANSVCLTSMNVLSCQVKSLHVCFVT